MKALWKNQIIAESDETVIVEGNHYFPISSVNMSLLQESNHSSYCPWKGTASYYSIEVDGETNKDAAWFYAEPKTKAEHIKRHLAFWKGVQIIEG